MESYHPAIAPDLKIWLKLDEGERILLVSDYHEQAGEELLNVQMYIAIHVRRESVGRGPPAGR